MQRLKATCDEALSNVAIKFNLRRYSKGAGAADVVSAGQILSGDAEDLGFAYLGHLFACRPTGPAWPAAAATKAGLWRNPKP
jgi:hypothetical protein